MLIGERMSRPVISVTPDMPVHDARNLFKQENIRRAPVVNKGKMIGIVSDQDLINASPSLATSLSIWELNYLLSKIKVEDVMTKDVTTIDEDTPIEQAARLMADNKIGGLPVMRDGKVVGMITETDLFKIFLVAKIDPHAPYCLSIGWIFYEISNLRCRDDFWFKCYGVKINIDGI